MYTRTPFVGRVSTIYVSVLISGSLPESVCTVLVSSLSENVPSDTTGATLVGVTLSDTVAVFETRDVSSII